MVNARNLIRILRCFELASGLKVNINKSKLFGISCSANEVEPVAGLLKCQVGSFPITYLGLPIGASMGRAVHWSPIVEKFKSKLSRWKASTLSFGGRVTLCKAVLGALGTYFFSLYKAPDKVVNELERIRMKFFWGGSLDKRKITWISWKKTLGPKENGGLGIGSLKAHNLALMGKWWWKFLDSKSGLWKEVVKAIHQDHGSLFNQARPSSGCWGTIARLKNHLAKIDVSFAELFQRSTDAAGESRLIWVLDKSNGYSVGSLAKFIDNHNLPRDENYWDWNNLIPGKVNILVWRALHARLPTLENLKRIGLDVDVNCRMCKIAPESEDHVFIHCPLAKQVWKKTQQWWYCLGGIPSSSRDLIKNKNAFVGPAWLAEVSEAICSIFMWVIWCFRNKGIFKNEFKTHLELAAEIQILAFLWLNARKKAGSKLDWSRWIENPVVEFCNSVK